MLGDIARALAQAGDPRFLVVLAKGVVVSVLALLALVAAAGWAAAQAGWEVAIPWIGQIDLGAGLAIGGVILASIFLMVPVAALCVGVFLDDVAAAVEARHYPAAGPGRALGFFAGLGEAARVAAAILVLNTLGLAAYLVAGPLAPLVFWALNGFLIGREYFVLVAARHLGAEAARMSRRRHALSIWALGTAVAIPLTIPVVNLFAPIFGVAAFTHFYHRRALRG